MMRMVMVSFTLKVTDKTASKTKKLPNAEAITRLQEPNKKPPKLAPNIPAPRINNATPKLAPLLSPRTKGPASGFLKSVCINNPETANPPPDSIAVIALGNRYSNTINFQADFIGSPPNKLMITSFKGIGTVPKLMLAKKVIKSIEVNSKKK